MDFDDDLVSEKNKDQNMNSDIEKYITSNVLF